MRRRTFTFGLALLLLSLLPPTAHADALDPERAQRVSRIVNGLPTQDNPATGALLYSADGIETEAGASCTGILIGCQSFLTGAHCIAEEGSLSNDLDPSHYFVFLQNAGFFAVETIWISPDYATISGGVVTAWGDELADIAVVKLAQPVTGIAPKPLLTTDPFSLFGSGGSYPGRIVGFGLTQGFANDLGIKREGQVAAGGCPQSISSSPVGEKVLCWEFAEPIGPAGEDSNTCSGDSGGPLFFTVDGSEAVAGVTQAGVTNSCEPDLFGPDTSWDTSVYYYLSFVQAALGDDPTTACGAVPSVGSEGASTLQYDGSLAIDQSVRKSFSVPSGTTQLRIALNGIEDGLFDSDLFVRAGEPPSSSASDCEDLRVTPSGFCQFESPTSGNWYVDVANVGSGSGSYQLTVTRLPEPTSAAATLTVLGSLFALATCRRRSRANPPTNKLE